MENINRVGYCSHCGEVPINNAEEALCAECLANYIEGREER